MDLSTKIIYDEAVWQNPDLCQENLWRMIGTNRTYLQKAIKELGFSSYYDMLSQLRVDFVIERLRESRSPNLQEIFFKAGYRSRATANRNFFNIEGCSPSEFIEKNTSAQNASDRPTYDTNTV